MYHVPTAGMMQNIVGVFACDAKFFLTFAKQNAFLENLMNMKRLVIFLLVALIPLMALPQDPISRPGKKPVPAPASKPKPKPKPKPSKPTTGSHNGYEWVDLGLSVKWATCNVGANSPSDYGDYYAWGETSTKSSYDKDNSSTYGKSMGNIGGNSSYDVARYRWGGSWRLPTKAELEELETKCTWTWTTQGGHNGYKVTGKNGKSIFLPAAGWRNGTSPDSVGEYGNYWSSSSDEGDAYYAYYLYFYSSNHYVDWGYRYLGRSVRPVVE